MSLKKGSQPRILSNITANPALNSRNWTFIKPGLDDFRDGFPPLNNLDIIVRRSEPVPTLYNIKHKRKGRLHKSKSRLTPGNSSILIIRIIRTVIYSTQ